MGRSWVNPIKSENASKKGALFTKYAKAIQVAAKLGGPDPEYNARLRMVLEEAKKHSVPNDTIERAIKKGAGLIDGDEIEEITYEGFGPHGVAVIVETHTDNRTRTVAEIRNLFKKHGGNLGESGSVAWIFERVGLIEAAKNGSFDPEEEAIEANANGVNVIENGYEFITAPTELDAVRSALLHRAWDITKAELGYKPKNFIELTTDSTNDVINFLNQLNDHDDTHRIYANLDQKKNI